MNRTRRYYSQLAVGLAMGLSSFGIAHVEAKKPVVVPQISGVAPSLVVSTTPKTFTIAGSNFQSGLTVSVGVAGSITSRSFQWTVTPSKAGTLVVQVTNPDGQTSNSYSTMVTAPPSPVIACPAAQSATSSTGQAVSVSYPLPTVTGGVAPVTTACSPVSGSAFALGTTSVACAATDALQQSASCTFAVSVAAAVVPPPPPPPPAPPTIQCPVNQTAGSTDGGPVAVSFPAPMISGGAAPVMSSCSPASGTLFSVGSTNVTCSATDSLSRTTACQFSTLVLAPPAPPPPPPPSSGDPTTLPLVQSSNLVYQGAFRLPGNDSQFAFGGQALAYNPASDPLFVESASNPQGVGEVSIPTLVKSPSVNDLSIGALLQAPVDPTEGHLTGSATGGTSIPAGLRGLLVSNGELYGSAGIYYDANNDLRVSHYRRSTSLATPSFDGFHGVWQSTAQGFVSGYLAAIPAAWQTLLHGDIFSGNFGQPVVTRESWGPAAIAWSSSEFTSALIPATPLTYYSSANPTLGPWDGQNVNFGMASVGSGAALPVGTRSVLVFGVTGLGPACYGPGTANLTIAGTPYVDAPGEVWCYDPTDSSKGTHAYPYRWNVWAYDANDLAAVAAGTKQPWDVLPYANFGLTFPIGSPSKVGLGGVAYDPATNRLFVAELGVDPGMWGYAAKPLVHVFSLQMP